MLDGFQINMDKPVQLEKYNRQREELLKSGSITEDNGKYYLHATLQFNSPSGAGDFVLGGSTNGWTEWKNAEGKTLNALFRKA